MQEKEGFVGLGFGPIQAGLFLYEAASCGAFQDLTVAEIDQELVQAVRENKGFYNVNIARKERVEIARVGPIHILNPRDAKERELIEEKLSQAKEAATALPSVEFYNSQEGSPAHIIASALSKRKRPQPMVIYAAENHNHAAELLRQAVQRHNPQRADKAEYLNTVIGKMSGCIRGKEAIEKNSLAPVAPGIQRAFLVEEFNRILVSRPERTKRALLVFEEKEDLLPFEEAKLYGHNAAHFLLGSLAFDLGCRRMPECLKVPGLLAFVREAFIQEAGAALLSKYNGLDPLFTPEGFRAYAEDLLERMTRRSLNDEVSRVIRDPLRKLGPNDRIFGTIKLCKEYGVGWKRFAFGSACALWNLKSRASAQSDPSSLLKEIWGREEPELIEAAKVGWKLFLIWRKRGRPSLVDFWKEISKQE